MPDWDWQTWAVVGLVILIIIACAALPRIGRGD